MSLQHATLQQLMDWQREIIDEIGHRAALAVATMPVSRAPWEMQAAINTHVMGPPSQAEEIAALRAQLAQRGGPTRPTAPPSMLGGQQPIRPGVVIATDRTDPALAAKFAQQPVRHEGVAGMQGNGRGEGMASFGDG